MRKILAGAILLSVVYSCLALARRPVRQRRMGPQLSRWESEGGAIPPEEEPVAEHP